MVAGIKRAIRKAGLNGAPLNQRAWQWLKDHPDHTANEIGAAIGEKGSDLSSILGKFFDRDMVTRKVEPTIIGTKGVPTYRYKINPKMKEFEMWPITAAGKKRHDDAVLRRIANKARKQARKDGNVFSLAGSAHLPVVAPEPEVVQPAVPQLPKQDGLTADQYAELILEHMNVKAAYKLHLVLMGMFHHPEKTIA